MKARSPVLGYNHNVRYAGRLWHVQTEDSGVGNPHLFTHLFSDGTILATKRFDYDPSIDVTAVQKFMQSQHKAMLRELKAGAFDEKIERFFGQPVVREVVEESTDPGKAPILELEADAADEDPALGKGPPTDPALPPVPLPSKPIAPPAPRTVSSTAIPRPPSSTAVPRPPTMPPVPPPRATATGSVPKPIAPPVVPKPPAPASPPRGAVGGIGSRRSQPPPTPPPGNVTRPSAEGVVVARPAVIIGGDSSPARRDTTQPRGSSTAIQTKRWHTPGGAPPEPEKPAASDNIFGGDLISEKSLDEVILAYLSEDLNDK